MGNQASSSSSISHIWTYDVFLSFIGENTALGFISRLSHSLHQWKFHAFVDDNIMTRENIASALFRVIQESRIAIIVFLENYVSTAFSLEELAKILECFQEEGRLKYLVLYDVDLPDPGHLRGSYAEALARLEERYPGHLRGSYAEALARLEERFEDKRQDEYWGNALSNAAGLKHIHLKPSFYSEKSLSSIISYFFKSACPSGIQGFQGDLTPFDRCVKVKRIGAGGFGEVHVGFNCITGEICAIKEMRHIDNGTARSLNKEVQTLSRLEHQNIVKYYDSNIVNSQITIYMEYIETGSLEGYINSRGALQESEVRYFTAQILSGLVYLHKQRVVHRDIKPGNILVDSKNIAKLADFGLAKHVAHSAGKHSVEGTICYAAPEVAQSAGKHSVDGTAYYAAPELYKREAYKSSGEACAADIWSLGCVVIEMLTGRRPWSDCIREQVMHKVGGKNQDPKIPENLSSACKDFLKSCFIRDLAQRPSAAALLKHPFVTTQTQSLKKKRRRNGQGI